MPGPDVILEILDDGEVVGLETADGTAIELWIESEAVAVEVPVTEYFEFDDGRGPTGPPGPQNVILLEKGASVDPAVTPVGAIIFEKG